MHASTLYDLGVIVCYYHSTTAPLRTQHTHNKYMLPIFVYIFVFSPWVQMARTKGKASNNTGNPKKTRRQLADELKAARKDIRKLEVKFQSHTRLFARLMASASAQVRASGKDEKVSTRVTDPRFRAPFRCKNTFCSQRVTIRDAYCSDCEEDEEGDDQEGDEDSSNEDDHPDNDPSAITSYQPSHSSASRLTV
jgi:hypothetical protein